ncbi:hypothetical protein ABW20_dc0105698 [Dactylellina cionopaga]|nr:hypothetical protein ABW20_dc0105698 [Dactylellina cionopaga]
MLKMNWGVSPQIDVLGPLYFNYSTLESFDFQAFIDRDRTEEVLQRCRHLKTLVFIPSLRQLMQFGEEVITRHQHTLTRLNFDLKRGFDFDDHLDGKATEWYVDFMGHILGKCVNLVELGAPLVILCRTRNNRQNSDDHSNLELSYKTSMGVKPSSLKDCEITLFPMVKYLEKQSWWFDSASHDEWRCPATIATLFQLWKMPPTSLQISLLGGFWKPREVNPSPLPRLQAFVLNYRDPYMVKFWAARRDSDSGNATQVRECLDNETTEIRENYPGWKAEEMKMEDFISEFPAFHSIRFFQDGVGWRNE